MTLELKINDNIPNFSLPLSDDTLFNSEELKKKLYIIYFYPKDNTPGCNKEACGFRDVHTEIVAKNALVLGVSADSVTKHEKFIEKFELPFKLIADENKDICNAYGVWGEKKFMGRTYLGINRQTFLIDGDGIIQKIWPKVKVAEHAKEVLDALEAL